jgi:CheY-like chemotaxis protein
MSPEVLLVESSLNVAGSVIYTLRKTIPNITIAYVKTVSQALDYLFHTGQYADQTSSSMPDLILLSLDLPDEGGIELLQISSAYMRTQKIPIVLMAEASTLIPALEKSPLDVNRFIVKSGKREEFTQAVSRAVAYWLEPDAAHHAMTSADNLSGYAVAHH